MRKQVSFAKFANESLTCLRIVLVFLVRFSRWPCSFLAYPGQKIDNVFWPLSH